ncbi:hypothetical protein PHAVU_004G008500 [Phaseolus vulgaris]|uniref:Uncharacterized protein n=1 Tax=Phaseolus vulgaris TaxID=3885 RepID=V7C0X1_PHAVU|nr:hypothetical protein PHAVU_004G008500g [Phaseolus vulgaris]ESW22945.1 hypothetical protein PHAVU_004G008500g [Phaseolus vulgaris]
MGRLGVHRNAYTFNIMTHVLCKDGDTDKCPTENPSLGDALTAEKIIARLEAASRQSDSNYTFKMKI